MPATSAPSERVFLYAEIFFGKLRQQVGTDMIVSSAFLKSAIALYGDDAVEELHNN